MNGPFLGLLLGSQRRDMAPPALYAAVEQEAAAAIDGGLDALVAPEHLRAEPYAMLRAWPLLAALRARFDGANAATIGSVIAGLSSLEQTRGDLATLSGVGSGPVGVALAAGYRPDDFAAAGREFEKRFALRAEMRAALAGGPWTWSAAANARAASRAVADGAAWYGAPTLNDADAAAIAREAGGSAVLRRDVLLGESAADVAARYDRWVAPKHGALSRWGYADGTATEVLAGTPPEVAKQLNTTVDVVGPAGIVVRLCWPDMDAAAGLEHVKAFAAEVVPLLGAATASRAGARTRAVNGAVDGTRRD